MSIQITFSTCWYRLKSKFNVQIYLQWINHMLSNVNNYYLVVYTNKESFEDVSIYEKNKNIKFVLRELPEF